MYLTAVHCFNDGYVGKQPAAWKSIVQSTGEKNSQESMDALATLIYN